MLVDLVKSFAYLIEFCYICKRNNIRKFISKNTLIL